MAQMALYRVWRPMDFDSVVAQQQVVQTLKQAVKNGEVGHAYLFCGTRGTGKTSLAKIMARAVNCLNPQDGNPCNQCEICQAILDNTLLDVQEIDAASNNSVDNVRRIIDEIVFLPVLAKYKVYIVDEVHMLSAGAFNALLKTLEEPPAHAIFILATTDPHRIPATILSRCQRFDFRRIPDTEIVARLKTIATDERITIDAEGLQQIAVLGDGALRDAISLLDQSRLSFPEGITAEKVRGLVGSVNKLFYADLAEAMKQAAIDRVLQMVATMVAEGRDIARFSAELASFFRDILVAKVAPHSPALISGSAEEKAKITALAQIYEQSELSDVIFKLSALMQELRRSEQPRTSLEITLIAISAGLRKLEKQIPRPTVSMPQIADVAAASLQSARVTEYPKPEPDKRQATQTNMEVPVVPENNPAVPIESPEIERTPPALQEEAKPQISADSEDTRIPAKAAQANADSEALSSTSQITQVQEESKSSETTPKVLQEDTPPEPGEAHVNETEAHVESPFDLLRPEELALLSPELLASTQAQFRQEQIKKQESAPQVRASDGSYDPEQLKRFWQETLDTLSVEEPFLFLFAREAQPQPMSEGLELHFAERTRHHYNVLSSTQGHDAFTTWDEVCAPERIPLKLVTHFASEEDPAPVQQQDDDWMKRIRMVAEELNIPFEDEREE